MCLIGQSLGFLADQRMPSGRQGRLVNEVPDTIRARSWSIEVSLILPSPGGTGLTIDRCMTGPT